MFADLFGQVRKGSAENGKAENEAKEPGVYNQHPEGKLSLLQKSGGQLRACGLGGQFKCPL